MTESAFCWVNGVGMPHEWKTACVGGVFGRMTCVRCGEFRNFRFADPPKNAQEGQDAKNSDESTPEKD